MKLYQYGVLGLSMLLTTAGLADFQYQETTQITGGSILSLMNMAGHFSRDAKRAGEPTVSTVYVQGNRMARFDAKHIEIIDLDKEIITSVDLEKHSYTEMTFEQMRQQLQMATEKMKEQAKEQQPSTASEQPPSNVDLKFSANVRNTGATKQVSGLNASESILTMQMEGTDKTNGQKGAFAITNDMWLASDIPGYGELREFQKKLALKMSDIYNGSDLYSSLSATNPGMAQGMSEMMKEVKKLNGIPVQQITRMGATANGAPLPAASEAPLPPGSSGPQMPSGGDVAKQAADTTATQSANSAISSKLGKLGISGFSGFGGFGHKKNKQPPPDNADNTQQTPTATVLMESTTEMTSFSSAPIDGSRFSVPAGFQQLQPIPPRH